MKYASGQTPRVGDRVDPIAFVTLAGPRTVVRINRDGSVLIARTLPLSERGGSALSTWTPEVFTLVRRSFPAGTLEDAFAAAYSNDPTELEIAIENEKE